MTDEQQALLAFFERVAHKDKALLHTLSERPGFCVEQACWSFTLPDLHYFLRYQDELFADLSYKQFRQLIYSCPINQTIKILGAEIIVMNNYAKVNQSRYALVWSDHHSRP